MKSVLKLSLAIVATTLFLTGCDQFPQAGGSSVAILDLAAVAKATGQDEVIRQEAELARGELSAQLQQLAANLETQLAAEREKAGITPSEADAQRLQELTMQARQQIGNAQQQAQNQAALIENGLVEEFRTSLQPLVEDIAKKQGATAVLAADSYLFWFDSNVDITGDVITAWRALPANAPVEEVVEASPAVEEVAEVQAELEEVEEELAEVEEDIAELKEALEEEVPAAQ
jgi:Skp family chaperone for outer membrane proteins